MKYRSLAWCLWLTLFCAAGAPAAEKVGYLQTIQPIFNQKCLACHGCSQSPCQLNLGSYEGVQRGALKLNAYAARPHRVDPVRLFIDGDTEADWRRKGFWSVIGTPKSSILWEMLELKKDFSAQPITESTETVLKDSSMCQDLTGDHRGNVDRFRRYFRRGFTIGRPVKTAYGMPYGLPELFAAERAQIRAWLDEGALGPDAKERKELNTPKSEVIAAKIKAWEDFFNGSSLKQRVTARYLYEHLFLAHLYFGDARDRFQVGAENEFYRLVRTSEKEGPVTTESKARHPYDEPRLGAKFYYRLRKVAATIVHKSHITYQLNDRKMERFKELFLATSWEPAKFPPYGAEGSNPFTTYADIPAWARYQFLLDDAEFFTRNDIRGPVCSGNHAVNVIQDLGWRMYLKPDSDVSVSFDKFFEQKSGRKTVADLLDMPAETQGSTLDAAFSVLDRTFRVSQQAYVQAKHAILAAEGKRKIGVGDIWDGNGNGHHNLKYGETQYPGALQTIVRNYDSADVTTGLHGNLPKTAELFDFPIMERTYYDLVTGFDVYGSTIDGLNTRVYKDALRIEGEDNFLRLAPQEHRHSIRRYWYTADGFLRRAALNKLMDEFHPLLPRPSADYETKDTDAYAQAREGGEKMSDRVMRHVAKHFRALGLGRPDHINCEECGDNKIQPERHVDLIKRFAAMEKGRGIAQYFPEVSFVRIGDGGDDDAAFVILANRFRTNTKFALAEGLTVVPERDRLMVSDELLGSFPNIYFRVGKRQVDQFITQLEAIRSAKDYAAFQLDWGVGRNDPSIFALTEWFYQQGSQRNPVEAARYDLSRYEIFYKE